MWKAARYIYAACQEKLDKRSENSACHGPYRDTDTTSLIDINETIAAILTDANSQSQSTAPSTPSPVTPATETGAQFLKR